MTSTTDDAQWPAASTTDAMDDPTVDDQDDKEEGELLDTAQFTSAGPPPVSRPSRWAEFLKTLEARGRDEDEEEDQATLGPFERPEQGYSVASRISCGKFPGSAPAGKFDATSRTLKKTDAEGTVLTDDEGEPLKHTVVWVRLNPEYVANPDAFPKNGDSPED